MSVGGAVVLAMVGLGVIVLGRPAFGLLTIVWTVIGAFAVGLGFGGVIALRRRIMSSRRSETDTEQDSAQLAAAAERTRIAREMHDIVAHSLSVVIAQADGGRYAATTDPAAATRALGTIAETGRAALEDMRRILGVLRNPDEDPDTTQLRVPVPDSQDVSALVAQMREAGLDIAMVRVGVGSTLPPGVGLALYRICQEALTNVLKHAGPGVKVTVVDRWEPTRVCIEVHDDGRGAAALGSQGPGHGLIGMRERAEMFGGTLEAGPSRSGGFSVVARIPLPARRPQTGPIERVEQ
ncbi:MAG: histidine kinase [Bifidobacteriaceae bacterium]|nr:histidine kinase [Bifidobacteriaceae bacterium]